jgi:dTDP-4-dehydrorhamnose reductase
MRILVLGSTGMAGHLVTTYLTEKGYELDNLSGSRTLDKKTIKLDVMKSERFEEFLKSEKYDVIVNCIGILVQKSEERKDLSTYLNSFLPHFLEHFHEETDTKVIHLSTDCVFSGKNAPYKEDSPYDGELFYDRTKAIGEIKNNKDLTFRMSIIGPEINENGVGLFNWFYHQKGEVSGYTRAIWTGVTTLELARGIDAAIKQNLTGIYHLVPRENISKFDLLNLFKEVFRREGIIIKPKDMPEIDKTLINTRKDFDFEVSDYRKMVEEMKEWIDSHKTLYKHYN